MKVLISILIGSVVTGVIAWYLCGMRSAVRELRYMSEMEAPLINCLDSIVEDYDNNEPELAEAKTRMLSTMLQVYWEERDPQVLHTMMPDILILELDEPSSDE